ncbi:MAG: hypothetical protein ACKOUR_01125 [Planctomycetota bacterium]
MQVQRSRSGSSVDGPHQPLVWRTHRFTSTRRLPHLAVVLGLVGFILPLVPLETAAQDQPLGEVFRRVIQVFGVQPGAVQVQVEEAVEAADEAPAEKEEMNKEEEEAQQEQWKQLEVHFTQQFRPMLSGHMNLLKQSAQPSEEQTKKIQQRGKQALKVSVTAMVEWQKKMQTGRWNPQTDKQPDPQGIFNQEIIKLTREELSPEQFQRLESAMQRREASRKRAAILCLLAKMDHDLFLSREQRDKMAEVLDKNWNSSWHRNLQFYLHDNGSNYPNIPSEPLAAVLTERQRQVWGQFPKVDLSNWGWGGFLAGMVGNVEPEEPNENEKEIEKDKEKKEEKTEATEEAKEDGNAKEKNKEDQAAVKPAADVAVVAQVQVIAQAVGVVELFAAPERGAAAVVELEADDDDQMMFEMPLEGPFDDLPMMMWDDAVEEVTYQQITELLAQQVGTIVAELAQGLMRDERVGDEEFVNLNGVLVRHVNEVEAFVNFEPEAQQEQDEEEDAMDAQQRAIQQAQANFEIGVENFDMWIYNNTGGRDQAKKRIDDQLQVFVDSMRKFFALNDDQLRKLELCGRGDVQRFQQQVERVRARFMLVRKDQQKFNEIWTDIGPLQQRLQQGFFNEQSLLAKSMPLILNEEQLKKYEEWQVDRRKFHYLAKIELIVAELESYTPFTVEQRDKIVQLVSDSGPPPRKRGQFDYIYVMYQMSQVPDAKWQAAVSKEQLEMINKLRNQGRQYQNYLKQNQVID